MEHSRELGVHLWYCVAQACQGTVVHSNAEAGLPLQPIFPVLYNAALMARLHQGEVWWKYCMVHPIPLISYLVETVFGKASQSAQSD